MSSSQQDILRQQYFELSQQCIAAIAQGANRQQLETINNEIQKIIRSLNEIDGRHPSEWILE